jgi:ABC-type glycerol-3-phosphate transport system permease component
MMRRLLKRAAGGLSELKIFEKFTPKEAADLSWYQRAHPEDTVHNWDKEEQKVFKIPTQWIPDPFVTDGYEYIFVERPFWGYIVNSFKVAILSTVGVVLSSSLAAYAFARVKFRG